jgi:N-acetylmuramoyl-L-alanine amidase
VNQVSFNHRGFLGFPLLVLVAFGWNCSSKRSSLSEHKDQENELITQAEGFLKRPTLPSRFEMVEMADQLAVLSVRSDSLSQKEQAAERAAQLRERLFRTFHEEVDAREASALWQAAAALSSTHACDYHLRRILLLGELSKKTKEIAEEVRTFQQSSPKCSALAQRALAVFGVDASASLPAIGASSVIVPESAVVSPQSPPPSAKPVRILSIDPFSGEHAGRVVIKLSNPTSFALGSAPPLSSQAGPRLYVDIKNTRVSKKISKQRAMKGLIKGVRVGQHKREVRVVLDLARSGVRRVFYLPDPFRVVIDVSEPMAHAGRNSQGKRRDIRRVVIDPGHGGQDPGAVGSSGLQEKEVTLDIAHRVAPVLARELGVTTLLTRDSDDFVPLEERTLRANAFAADLFISIHCNSAESKDARGIETYILKASGEPLARALAARENASSRGQISDKFLNDLQLTHLNELSNHVAHLLQTAALAALTPSFPGIKDGGVKTAGFFVLVGAQMPALLFETSFLSNPMEEERLHQAAYRQKLADAIVNAVRAYKEGL